MRELTPQHVLAGLFDSDEFHTALTNYEQAAALAVQRLDEAGFRILDAPNATTVVLGIAHRGAGDRPLWAAYAKAIIAVPPDLVPAATTILTGLVESRS